MGQVTLYLDRETEIRARAAAKAEGMTLLRWVSEALHRRLANRWPASVLRLAGAWKDFPSARKIRRGAGRDVRRKRL